MSNHTEDFFDQYDFADGLMAGFAQDGTEQFIDPALLQLNAGQPEGLGRREPEAGTNMPSAPEDLDWDHWLNDISNYDEGAQHVNAPSDQPPPSHQHHGISAESRPSSNLHFQVDRSMFDHDAAHQSFQRTAASGRLQEQNPSLNMHHIPNLDRAAEGHFSPASWSNQLPALRTPQMQQTLGIGRSMAQNDPFGVSMRSIEAEHQQYGLHQQRFTQWTTQGQHSRLQQGLHGPQYQNAIVHSAPQQSPGISYQYSPDPEETPDREFSDAGRRPKGKGKARDGSTPHENPRCVDCGKRYRLTKSEGRCSRCADKHIRKLAGQKPHTYLLDASVPDIAAARAIVSPHIPGRKLNNDDYHRFAHQEDVWVQRLMEAVNVVQSEATDGSVWALRQQTYLNEKAELEKGYSDQHVTARLRALYQEIVNYHVGGPAVYAIGGDNAGYTDNRILTFTKRIRLICEIMANNKRVVMDVVEGRGVQGLVANPEVYNRRKQSNNNCNEEKKRIMEKGKEVEGVVAGPKTKTKTRKRRRTGGWLEGGDFDAAAAAAAGEGEDVQAGPSEGVRRSPRLAEQLENALADLEGVERRDEVGDDEYVLLQGYSAYKQPTRA